MMMAARDVLEQVLNEWTDLGPQTVRKLVESQIDALESGGLFIGPVVATERMKHVAVVNALGFGPRWESAVAEWRREGVADV